MNMHAGVYVCACVCVVCVHLRVSVHVLLHVCVQMSLPSTWSDIISINASANMQVCMHAHIRVITQIHYSTTPVLRSPLGRN